jgi:hypothetical protein
MKKVKIARSFYFKDLSHQQVVDYMNINYPISLKNNQDLVERVYQRYPLIDKSEVGIIVKAVFSSIRDLLILGKVLNFNKLFFDCKLSFFTHRKKGVIFPALKACVSTPPSLRNYDK